MSIKGLALCGAALSLTAGVALASPSATGGPNQGAMAQAGGTQSQPMQPGAAGPGPSTTGAESKAPTGAGTDMGTGGGMSAPPNASPASSSAMHHVVHHHVVHHRHHVMHHTAAAKSGPSGSMDNAPTGTGNPGAAPGSDQTTAPDASTPH